MMAACACRLVRGAVMEFRLLGHVEVWAADRRLELGPPQRRAVLAALAVHAGRPLPRDTLVSRVWPAPECVPDGAVQALHSHLSHIRGTLESAAARPVLVRQPAGYVLEVDPEQVDLHRFRRLPLDVDDRAARYRTEINGRRMLVVLDNAASVEQVRPLLLGTPSCVVLVTSRDSLASLIAVHGGRRLDLGLLPLGDAVTLLHKLIGMRAEALAMQCARLPLALRVAAELATARPTTPLADLVRELADQRRRLERLGTGGDPRADVRAVFSWSYKYLPADAARAFRLAGLHPGADLDPYAGAALTNTSLDQARRLFDTLARAHLVHLTGPGRFGMHDLLRAYATDLTTTLDSESDRRTALTSLFDYYLAAAAVATEALRPAERRQRSRIFPPRSPTPSAADPAAAMAWLDAERANLVAACAHTAAHGWPRHTTRLATTLFRYLDISGHFPDALSIHTEAGHAARQTGDRAAEAHALTNLGLAHWRQGRYEQAAEHYGQAMSLFCETGDRDGEARTLTNLGLVYWRWGRYEQAAENHLQALAFYNETGHRYGQANAFANLGVVHLRQGCYEQAADDLNQALALFRATGNRVGEAYAVATLGVVHR